MIVRLLSSLLYLFLACGVFRASAAIADPKCEDPACEQVQIGGTALRGISKTTYRYWGFRVFDATLFAPSPHSFKGDIPIDVPSALRLCYLRSISREELVESGDKTLELNPTIQIGELRERIDRLHSRFVDVKEGDCYQLNHSPETGLSLLLNGNLVETIPGKDFAQAYLGIWLSEYSFSPALASRLTGRES